LIKFRKAKKHKTLRQIDTGFYARDNYLFLLLVVFLATFLFLVVFFLRTTFLAFLATFLFLFAT